MNRFASYDPATLEEDSWRSRLGRQAETPLEHHFVRAQGGEGIDESRENFDRLPRRIAPDPNLT